MLQYVDTSALAKRYFAEPGTERMNALLAGNVKTATSILTYAEMLAVAARKRKAGDITAGQLRTIAQSFEADWKLFHVIPLKDDIRPLIRTVVGKYRLRGADGVHLASALFLAQAIQKEMVMVASDIELLDAAKKAGFKVVNPALQQ
ncbi:MAG: type II toxin-antitoxin system VapC family toxin [Nitrospinae bacterium]|nr:type II toxin-antitoxin system VapC family toxin [Nitrospinota bacterium]